MFTTRFKLSFWEQAKFRVIILPKQHGLSIWLIRKIWQGRIFWMPYHTLWVFLMSKSLRGCSVLTCVRNRDVKQRKNHQKANERQYYPKKRVHCFMNAARRLAGPSFTAFASTEQSLGNGWIVRRGREGDPFRLFFAALLRHFIVIPLTTNKQLEARESNG